MTKDFDHLHPPFTGTGVRTEGAGERVSWNQAGHGDLRVVELDGRRDAHIRQSHIAGVIAIKPGGPARILFSGGGHIDVCGDAEQLRLEIRIAELSESRNG